MCPLAYEDTHGRCVQKQMEALTREEDLEKDFDEIYAELYGEDHDDNPYLIETEDGSALRYDWRDAGIHAPWYTPSPCAAVSRCTSSGSKPKS